MMKHAIGLLFLLVVAVHADTLTLRNGSNVTGTWLGADANQITFLVDGQARTYPRSDIAKVTFGSEPPKAASGIDPEIIGAIYVQRESGALVQLERTQATAHNSATINAVGSKVSGRYWEMDGSKAPIRIKNGQKMMFVVRLSYGMDPGSYILSPLEARSDSRRTKSDPRNRSTPLSLPLKVTKVGESSYGLTPVADLPPGEYAFSPNTSNDVYCFGVDQGSADPAGEKPPQF
jgi:hypothetical protein